MRVLAVSPLPANVSRHFLPWDRPLLPQAVAWLARDWSGTGPLDLARWLVVVPTRQAGRRLREALAEHAAEAGQAVFPPRVVTPRLKRSTSSLFGFGILVRKNSASA